jgi:hypothetical protein
MLSGTCLALTGGKIVARGVFLLHVMRKCGYNNLLKENRNATLDLTHNT